MNCNNVIYFDNFGVKHIQIDIKKFIGRKNIIINVYSIQEYDAILCGYYCTGFIYFMLKSKRLLEYINLFSPKEYENNDEKILKYFH